VKIFKSKINILENIVEKLYNKMENIELFFEINNLLVKQFIKTSKVIKFDEEKFNVEDFNEKINELSPNKFINWLLS
jgi:hypothetical protein